MVNGADQSAPAAGVQLISENGQGDKPGGISLRRYLAEGWNVLLF
jgi:hypothetical protein